LKGTKIILVAEVRLGEFKSLQENIDLVAAVFPHKVLLSARK
jgi:hypothetical protein